jgi:alpha-L-fucosidase
LQTIWSRESYRKIFELVDKEKPDIVHFHNTFPLISTSEYYACRKAEKGKNARLEFETKYTAETRLVFSFGNKDCPQKLQFKGNWMGTSMVVNDDGTMGKRNF